MHRNHKHCNEILTFKGKCLLSPSYFSIPKSQQQAVIHSTPISLLRPRCREGVGAMPGRLPQSGLRAAGDRKNPGSTGLQPRRRRPAEGLAGQPGSLEAELDKPSLAEKHWAIEDLLTRLPRRAGPKGEPAARAGPSGGHGGGAQCPGPKGEPRGHGGPGRDAVNGGETSKASVPSRPRQDLQHHRGPAGTRRGVQPLQLRGETGGGGVTRARPKNRKRTRRARNPGTGLEVVLASGSLAGRPAYSLKEINTWSADCSRDSRGTLCLTS